MYRTLRNALTVAAALQVLAVVGCTDTTELPTSTITDNNYFNDPSAYRQFLARIYCGARRQRTAGACRRPGHRRHR